MKTLVKMCIYWLFKLLPLKRRVLISSYLGLQKSDSPLQIYNYIRGKYPKMEVIFFVRKRQNNIVYSKFYTIKYLFFKATSEVIFDNMFADSNTYVDNKRSIRQAKILSFVKGRMRQKYVSTWHGTPLKKIERDIVGSTITDCIINKPLYLVLGNTYTAEILNHVLFDKAEIKLFGSPRNDILINSNETSIIEYKKNIDLPLNKKIVLYAPTFRSNAEKSENYIEPSGIEQMRLMQFDTLFHTLTEKFGGEWVMVCRFHYLVADMVDWEQLETDYPEKFINGNRHEDMAEYLLCSDILITDYSSCMFDYAILNRPIFLFCHDLEHYRTEERGFYLDIDTLPFSLAESFDSLCDNIMNFNDERYCDEIEQMKKEMGYCEEGNATERAGDFIYRLLEDD